MTIVELQEILDSIGSKRGTGNNQATYIEFSLISAHINKLKWENLSREQKQKKRKALLTVIKKYHEEDNTGIYYYENGLTKLYDYFLQFHNETAVNPKLHTLTKRLKFLVALDMNSIDAEATFKRKRLIPVVVYKNLKNEFLKENIEVPYLREIMQTLEVVHKNMPKQ